MLKDAHNHAKVDTIIFKPWDEHFLLKTIDELLQVFGSNLKNSLYLKSNSEIRKDKEEEENEDSLISKTVSYTHLTLPTTPYV